MNGQKALIKKSLLTFLSNGNTYDLNDSELSHFLTNKQLEQQIQNTKVFLNLLKDILYNISYGIKKSFGYNFIKNLYPQLGSGFMNNTYMPTRYICFSYI